VLGRSNQIQAKLRVGPANDPLEREADRVADAVVAGDSVASLGNAPVMPQRKCEECEAEEKSTVRRKAEGVSAELPHDGAEAAAAAVASGGAPLSPDVLSYFEPRFGRDLSDVRVHADSGAAQAASRIDARAYTLGRDIAFASGEYMPVTREGRRLIAHELAHVVQQDAALGTVQRHIMRQPAPAAATATTSPAPVSTATSSVDYGDAKWQADLKTFNDAVKPAAGSPDPKKISAAIGALVVDVGPSLTIPAGLPTGPNVEPWINPASADPNWTAYTYEHLVFAYPNDAWKWIGINRMAIQQTPGYTRTVLDHELQHASEMHVAAFDYQLINGPPPAMASGADKPGYKPDPSDPYGKYILDFNQYYHSGTTDMRHIEIYAQSAAPNFNRFAPQEKLAWLGQMISTVLPDTPRDEALPGEDLVEQVYTNMLPTESDIRTKFGDILLSQALRFLDDKDFGRTMTLLDHFTPVWELRPAAFQKIWSSLVLGKQGQKEP
jgi:hypothetical protein